ncbi:unnamed protein product [Onchocerca flexuosa]|uniref:ATP-dependent DNA helicase n=1 Tax=Onchocerca flexuosa TaxID=387005 RepID=A0A183GYP4_9BILA|nr:unnamed protein product [Onchocerca flexuosa]
MPIEIIDAVGENEGRKADEVADKSEEENEADDLKCLDWLVSYRLPDDEGYQLKGRNDKLAL